MAVAGNASRRVFRYANFREARSPFGKDPKDSLAQCVVWVYEKRDAAA